MLLLFLCVPDSSQATRASGLAVLTHPWTQGFRIPWASSYSASRLTDYELAINIFFMLISWGRRLAFRIDSASDPAETEPFIFFTPELNRSEVVQRSVKSSCISCIPDGYSSFFTAHGQIERIILNRALDVIWGKKRMWLILEHCCTPQQKPTLVVW